MLSRAWKKLLFIILTNSFIYEKIVATKVAPSSFNFEMENVMACSDNFYTPESPCKNVKFAKINRTTKSLSFDLPLQRPFDENTGGILELEKWTNEGWRKLPFIPMIPDACNFFLRHYNAPWSGFMAALGVKHPSRCPIPAGNYSMKRHIFGSGTVSLNSFPVKGRYKMRSLMMDIKTNKIMTCLEMIASQDTFAV